MFIVVDVATDDRLENKILQIPGGANAFSEIHKKLPAFVISEGDIFEYDRLKLSVIVPISEFGRDMGQIYQGMGVHTPESIDNVISFIKYRNRYFNFKPAVFGVGFNGNEILTDILKKIKRETIKIQKVEKLSVFRFRAGSYSETR